MNDLSKLGKFGLIGVMLGLIGLVSFSLWAYWKTVSNHIFHNTEVMGDFKAVIQSNTEVQRGIMDSINRLNETLKIRR